MKALEFLTRPYIQSALLAGAIIVLSLGVFLLQPSEFVRKHFSTLGYLGVFLFMFFSSATVLFPMPGLAAVFVMGRYMNPLFLGIAAGLGASFGELTGYAFGYSGKIMLDAKKMLIYERAKGWVKKNGFYVIFGFAVIPSPADIVGIAAGTLNYPVWKFWIASALGNIIKCMIFAYIGGFALHWF